MINVILAAGQSTRFKQSSKQQIDKDLMPFNGAPDGSLIRLVRQLDEIYKDAHNIVVINKNHPNKEQYIIDTGSEVTILKCDLDKNDNNSKTLGFVLSSIDINDDIQIFESDTFIKDKALFNFATNTRINSDDIIITSIGISPHLTSGGFIYLDNTQLILYIGERKSDSDLKLFGITRIPSQYVSGITSNLLNVIDSSEYFHAAIYEFISKRTTKIYDFGEHSCFSFNNVNELNDGKRIVKTNHLASLKMELIDLNRLVPIESVDNEKVQWLKRKIIKDNLWITPIITDIQSNLVMDGHHRYAAALELGLTKIPCLLASYKNVDCWSINTSFHINPEILYASCLQGFTYPWKTVKHDFDNISIKSININLDNLR